MSFFQRIERKTIFAAFMLVVACALFNLYKYMPLFVLAGHFAAATYLVIGAILSLRSPNEIALPALKFAGRILHAQIFYSLLITLFASILSLLVQGVLALFGLEYAARWAMLVAFSLAVSTPIVMAFFSRFLLSRTAGWDRLKFAFRPKNLLVLPVAIVAFAALLALALSPIIDSTMALSVQSAYQWGGVVVIWGGLIFLFSRTDFLVRNAFQTKSELETTNKSSKPSKILFVGADAADWHVIMPLAKSGRMPHLKSLMDSGTYGYLDTYGRMHSPVIWTTIATSASVDLHGINDFFKHDPHKKDKRTLFKSYDRKLPALWNMVNQMGYSVGVMNWLLTYPPEIVNGYMISHMREAPAVFPEELEGLLSDALSKMKESESNPESLETTTDMSEFRLVRPPEEAIKDLKRISAVAPQFMREFPTDLTFVYEDATDGIQHTTWQYREPKRFDPKAWGYDVADIQRYGNAIDEAWEEFDNVLGVLLEEFSSDGIVMVVSDHGFMPREAPSVYLDVNALLHDLGYLEFKADGSVDFSRTAVYWSTRDITSSFTDLSINLDKKTGLGGNGSSDLEHIIQQVISDLQSLMVNGSEPLFDYVNLLQEVGESSIRLGLTEETMTLGQGRAVVIGEGSRELDEFLKVVPDGSGRHDPLGVFVFSGPGIRKGQISTAGAMHTILNDLLGHIRGLSQNRLIKITFHLLERFGLINPYTTNDIAPTLLYLADCPIPEYSIGAVMDRILSNDLKSTRTIKFVEKYNYERDETGGEYSEDLEQKVIERLKALGYVD